jgi:hypothetical protein
MNTFEETISQMPSLLAKLMKKPLLNRLNIGKMPPLKGIYVFVENNCPIYVGRSKNIRNRFDQHCRNSSDHNSAPFAFNLAKEKYENKFGSTKGTSRKELSIIPAFSELFGNEKKRVSKMRIRMMEIDDPVAQTIFEVYAALKLNTTKYNDFDTH